MSEAENRQGVELVELIISEVLHSKKDKIEACRNIIRFLVKTTGITKKEAVEFFEKPELPHALAHPGPGQFIVRQDNEGSLYPFYRILDPENYTGDQIVGFIEAAGSYKSDEDQEMIRNFSRTW